MPGTANYKRLYRRVAADLNAIDRATYLSATPTIDDRRRVEGMIRDRIVAADARVATAICMSEENPHRARFLEYSGELEDGAKIPDRYGPLGEVAIKKHSAATLFEPGVEADSVEEILQWRENAGNVFGALAHDAAGSPLAGHFRKVGRRIRFTGYRAKVEIANFTMAAESETNPTLVSPDAFEDVIYAGARGFAIEGDDQPQAAELRNYFDRQISLILAGAVEAEPLTQS